MSDDMGIFSLAVPFADSVNQDFVHKMFYVVDCLGTLVIHGTSNSASATFMTIRLNPTAFDDISEEMREHRWAKYEASYFSNNLNFLLSYRLRVLLSFGLYQLQLHPLWLLTFKHSLRRNVSLQLPHHL
jgi:hypothetical protein